MRFIRAIPPCEAVSIAHPHGCLVTFRLILPLFTLRTG